MQHFDWNLLRSFIAVADTGSLSAAARKLGSSQPTVGRHIGELERDLGVVLFRRGLSGYELTETGINLFAKAANVREEMDRFSLHAFGAEEALNGTIRISASEMIATLVLPEILARFALAEPLIEVEVVATDQVENLLRRDADIAIRMLTPSQEELIARKIADIPLSLCATKGYIERRGMPEKPFDLAHHDLIGLDRNDAFVKGFTQFGMKVDRHDFRFRSDSQLVLWQATLAGIGVGIAQVPLIAREPTLQMLLPEIPLPILPMWLTMHKDVKTSPRIRRTADFLYEELLAFTRSADATRPASKATTTRKKAKVI